MPEMISTRRQRRHEYARGQIGGIDQSQMDERIDANVPTRDSLTCVDELRPIPVSILRLG